MGELLSNDTKSKPAIDAAAIRELADLLTETGLTEIEFEQGGVRLRVARQVHIVAGAAAAGSMPASAPATQSIQPANEPSSPKPEGPHPGAVSSPMVGTVYTSPQPGAPPFVKVGDSVKEGDTLLIVEAMKTMNPIAATRSGTVNEICVSDGQPVEFGQTLLVLS